MLLVHHTKKTHHLKGAQQHGSKFRPVFKAIKRKNTANYEDLVKSKPPHVKHDESL
jgi:hypothetical protein